MPQIYCNEANNSLAEGEYNWKTLFRRSAFFWWKRVDSNHRSRWRQIYRLLPLAARELFRLFSCLIKSGLELVDGLEPPTCWLQISCSTNWATPAWNARLIYHKKIELSRLFLKNFFFFIFMSFLKNLCPQNSKNGLCRSTARWVWFTLSLLFSLQLRPRFWDKQHHKALRRWNSR